MKEQIFLHGLGNFPLYVGLLIQMAVSLFLGCLIGWERERRLKSAGIKTHALICLGATLYTSLSFLNIAEHAADPNRVAAQIVSGIGFLGAGAIIQGRGNVVGLTTAAAIWAVAAVGVAVGSGYPLVAGMFTISIFLVLRAVDPLFELLNPPYIFRLDILIKEQMTERVLIMIKSFQQVEDIQEKVYDPKSDLKIIELFIKANPKKLKGVLREIRNMDGVQRVMFNLARNTADT